MISENVQDRIEELYFSKAKGSGFIKNNKEDLLYFRSWVLWYPDLFLDMNKPSKGSINLHNDQRVFLRALLRYQATYGVFSRSYSKTFLEVIGTFILCLVFPNINITMTAQTKENASKILSEKYGEIVKFFPFFKNEIVGQQFSTNYSMVKFANGSKVDTMANSHNSKGARRHRLQVEESALLDAKTFSNALRPVVDEARRNIKDGEKNYHEHHSQINFFTTAGYRNTSEFDRFKNMIYGMADLNGQFAFSSDYRLARYYGRGISERLLEKRRESDTKTAYEQNYLSKWVGGDEGGLLNTERLMRSRVVDEPEFQYTEEEEKGEFKYFIGVDVARSQNQNNNQGSIVIAKVRYDSGGSIGKIDIVNIIPLPNTDNFSEQALKIKKVQKLFKAEKVIVDTNGLGVGLKDELMQETRDNDNGDLYMAYNPVNLSEMPSTKNYKNVLYALKSQTSGKGTQRKQTDILRIFMGAFSDNKVSILKPYKGNLSDMSNDTFLETEMPFVQTDLLIEEIFNLELKVNGGSLSVKRRTKTIDKDRFSALSYLLWYILEHENKDSGGDNVDTSVYLSLFN